MEIRRIKKLLRQKASAMKRAFKIWIEEETIPSFLSIISATLGFFFAISTYLTSGKGSEKLLWIGVVCIGSLIIFCVGLFLKEGKSRKLHREKIEALISAYSKKEIVGIPVDRPALYKKMRSAAWELAEEKVYWSVKDAFLLTSYIPKSPADDLVARDYHNHIESIITARNIGVRRVVGIRTVSKLNWVLNQIDQFSSCENYDLVLDRKFSVPEVSGNVENDNERPTINIQIYGNKHYFLFGKRGNSAGKYLDNFHFQGELLDYAFRKHYEELWDRCSEDWVIRNGQINYHVLDSFIEHFSSDLNNDSIDRRGSYFNLG